MNTLLSLFVPFLMAMPAHAQTTPLPIVDACHQNIQASLSREERLYRRVLFGQLKATSAQVDAVHYDTEGNAWLKTAANTWRTQVKGFENTTWSDTQMDTRIERDPLRPDDAWTFREGIFATRGVLTSELVPSLTQSFRALQCRTLSVCDAARRSLNKEKATDGVYIIRIPGCREIPVPVLTACSSTTQNTDVGSHSVSLADCAPMAAELVNHEAQLLTLSVTYDAAYRSLLQFAGTFDDFLSVFRVDLLRPVRQSMPLLQQLSRIPCFLAQCNG